MNTARSPIALQIQMLRIETNPPLHFWLVYGFRLLFPNARLAGLAVNVAAGTGSKIDDGRVRVRDVADIDCAVVGWQEHIIPEGKVPGLPDRSDTGHDQTTKGA